MPIKNYTTVVPANRTITAIQDAPVKHGATGVLYKYEQGTGRIEALQFLLRIKNHDVAFSLPVNWRKFQRVLEIQQVRRWDEEDYVYRVAWRNIRDWVMAQLALYETEIVEMPQVFLPFATDAKGQTLYEKMVEGKCLLGPGPQDTSTKKTRRIRLHRVSHTKKRCARLSRKPCAVGRNRVSQGERYTSKVCRQQSGSSRGGVKMVKPKVRVCLNRGFD